VPAFFIGAIKSDIIYRKMSVMFDVNIKHIKKGRTFSGT
jgi:hypothetical protein